MWWNHSSTSINLLGFKFLKLFFKDETTGRLQLLQEKELRFPDVVAIVTNGVSESSKRSGLYLSAVGLALVLISL